MIRIEQLRLRVGSFELNGIDLELPEGSYGILMGRTGCGKTTLLEAVCGLIPPRSGTVRIAGRDITRVKPAERGIGYVPQDGALFQTMTVRDNIAFSLAIRGRPAGETSERVEEIASLLGVGPLLDRRPAGLSGGETQRVALGRALAFRPRVLCLDEPLSALDRETRAQMCELLTDIRKRTGVTVLHVTHDAVEAESLADHRFRLEEGRVRRD